MDDAPVFVVGCPRSGTTLLYHMLVSTGAFVNYRAETHLYDMLEPAVGSLRRKANRRRLMSEWSDQRSFRAFGVESEDVRRDLVEACGNAGEILTRLFRDAAGRQGRPRWAECTPGHLLYMDRIRSDLPRARFVHMIRDGRDVALSLRKVGWVHALPWDRGEELLVGSWQWDWMVRRGRRLGRRIGDAYREVRFEDLVRKPEATLSELSGFVQHELDYGQIMENPVGSVDRPNTAFGEDDGSADRFDPVARWRNQCSQAELGALEATVGDTLRRLAYPPPDRDGGRDAPAKLAVRKRLYQGYRDVRQALKDRTPLSRWLTAARPDAT